MTDSFLDRPIEFSAFGWARFCFTIVALALTVAGLTIFVVQLNVVQNNEGGTLVDFPSEIMTGTLGLVLLGGGLLMICVAFLSEVVLRRSKIASGAGIHADQSQS